MHAILAGRDPSTFFCRASKFFWILCIVRQSLCAFFVNSVSFVVETSLATGYSQMADDTNYPIETERKRKRSGRNHLA